MVRSGYYECKAVIRVSSFVWVLRLGLGLELVPELAGAGAGTRAGANASATARARASAKARARARARASAMARARAGARVGISSLVMPTLKQQAVAEVALRDSVRDSALAGYGKSSDVVVVMVGDEHIADTFRSCDGRRGRG